MIVLFLFFFGPNETYLFDFQKVKAFPSLIKFYVQYLLLIDVIES